MNNEVIVTNIQRFSLHDGFGIRTTVFFKGCTLNCPWCANPENIKFTIEDFDYQGVKGTYGRKITLNDLFNEIMKDYAYFETGGGVTFSGGEPLMQIDKINLLLKKLKDNDINICFETSLFVPQKNLKVALQFADELIVDLKILDEKMCKDVINGDLSIYMDNIEYLFTNFDHNKITMRLPITKEYVLNEKYVDKYIDFVKKYQPRRIEMFKLHHLGDRKYKTLHKRINYFTEVSDEELNIFKESISQYCDVKILNI